MVSATANTPARSGLIESNAPAPARLSICRRLSSFGSTRLAKSSSDVIGAAGGTLDDQRLHRLFAHALERGERIAHDEPVGRFLDVEVGLARIDAGRQIGDVHPPHVVDEDRRACRSAPCRSTSMPRRIRADDAP
jgi:hypothetical protein